MTKKPHGNTGRRNAKKDNPKSARIIMCVEPEVKAQLRLEADAEGIDVTKLIRRRAGF